MFERTQVAEYLKKRNIHFEVMTHSRHETALGTALAEHVSPAQMMKAVMVKIDGKDTMFVIPSDSMLALFRLMEIFETPDIHVEREREFSDLFPDCERGAMPPFGNLYGVPCYVDSAVQEMEEIYFNAGTHKEAVKMASKDFLRISAPVIGNYTVPRGQKH